MKTERHNHVLQQGEQLRCVKCSRIWDKGEDEPPCETDTVGRADTFAELYKPHRSGGRYSHRLK